MLNIFRKLILVLWLVFLIVFGIWLLQNQQYLEPKKLLGFFQSFGSFALVIYILISFIRGLILLPSLPLVLVGILFFPESPNLVFFISMLGIMFSSILVYAFSDFMGFDDVFKKHVNNAKIRDNIDRYGFYAVTLWSFVPVVPTDVICYVAGTVRMKFWKFVTAIFIGEGLIVGLIVYGGSWMIDWMKL